MHTCSACKQQHKDSDLAVKRTNVKGEPVAWRCKGCTRTANALWRNCGEKARAFQSPHERAAFFAANLGKSAEELMNVATMRSEEYDIQESECEDQAEIPYYTARELAKLPQFVDDEAALNEFLNNATKTRIHPESKQKLYGLVSYKETKKNRRTSGRDSRQKLEGDSNIKKEKATGSNIKKAKKEHSAAVKRLPKNLDQKANKKLEALDKRMNESTALSVACETQGVLNVYVPAVFRDNLDSLSADLSQYRAGIAEAKSEGDREKCEKLMKDCSESEKAHTKLADTIRGASVTKVGDVRRPNKHFG